MLVRGMRYPAFVSKPLDAAGRMKAKVIAVGTPEHLIDLGLESNVDGVLRLLDHGIEYHEPAPIFQYAKYFFHHSLGIVKVMQAKRHKGAIERFRFKR